MGGGENTRTFYYNKQITVQFGNNSILKWMVGETLSVGDKWMVGETLYVGGKWMVGETYLLEANGWWVRPYLLDANSS